MNEANKLIAIFVTNLVFTFTKLSHCPMALQYYTLKIAKQGSLARWDTRSCQSKINLVLWHLSYGIVAIPKR